MILVVLSGCAVNNGGCAQVCTDTEESYFCSCNPHFVLSPDGHSCESDFQPIRIEPETAPTPSSLATPVSTCPEPTLPTLAACQTILRGESGTLSSRNWPETYNNNEVCDWLIILPDCTKKVKITFHAFRVAGQMPHCAKDQVYVKRGLEEEGELQGPNRGPFCHLAIPEPIVIDSHLARITMVSGPQHGIYRLGFHATYETVDS